MMRTSFHKHANRYKDAACIALLLLLAALVFLIRNSALPMQIWDESRNANNALEMSRTGFSLVTRFHGVADHWSTKPPLLIWLMVACLRMGFSPLLAVRLPAIAAAIASVFTVFFFARIQLRDRLAGLFSALMLLASPLFAGWHTGRTGDYDSLVVFFTLAYALAFWRYLETHAHPQTRWIVLAGAALALGGLTKGVGGALGLPALLLYAMARGRVGMVLRNWGFYFTLLGVAFTVGGYYLLREQADPGYLAAVWKNEFTGRYLAVNEDHMGSSFYYLRILATKFEPGFLLLPLAAFTFSKTRLRRSSVALLCLLVAADLLAVLTRSQTKIFWYLAPATPFLALAAGIGLTDGMTWLRKQTRAAILLPLAWTAVAALFVVANLGTVYYYQFGVEKKLSATYMGGRYGPFLEEIRRSNLTHDLIVLDDGAAEARDGDPNSEFAHYSPEADFFATVEAERGMHVRVAVPGSDLPSGSWIATCDPNSDAWLRAHYQVAVALASSPWCVLGRTHATRIAYGEAVLGQ